MKTQLTLGFIFFGLFLSCERETLELDKKDSISEQSSSLTSTDLNPSNGYKNIEKTITLSYSSSTSEQATSCDITNLSNITETTPCSCSVGVCTVGVTGTSDFMGPASFSYTVSVGGSFSNSANASFTITYIGASNNEE